MSWFLMVWSLMSALVSEAFLMSFPVISLAAVAEVAPTTSATTTHAMIVLRTTASPQLICTSAPHPGSEHP